MAYKNGKYEITTEQNKIPTQREIKKSKSEEINVNTMFK